MLAERLAEIKIDRLLLSTRNSRKIVSERVLEGVGANAGWSFVLSPPRAAGTQFQPLCDGLGAGGISAVFQPTASWPTTRAGPNHFGCFPFPSYRWKHIKSPAEKGPLRGVVFLSIAARIRSEESTEAKDSRAAARMIICRLKAVSPSWIS